MRSTKLKHLFLFFFILTCFIACDKEKKIDPLDLPQLETLEVQNITATTSTFLGRMLDIGDSEITERGFCWSEQPNPSIANQSVQSLSEADDFSRNITNLKYNTTYYVRAYAINNTGIGYGNEIVFTTDLPEIGDRGPGGGLIFYLDGMGNGLEAAPTYQSLSARWGCGGTSIAIANDTTIGNGKINTNAIVKVCNTIGIAARLCDNLTTGGYTDWYLPNKGELNLMYENLHSIGLGNFADLYYWSSSQQDAGIAWVQNFYTGTRHFYNKAFECRVHAIRAF